MSLKNCPAVITLEPNNFTHNMWGGDWIPRLKNIPNPQLPVGESWEFSGHRKHPSTLKLLDGTPVSLAELLRKDFKAIMGRFAKPHHGVQVPFLIKFIDARDDLSLQVHPSEAYARRHERDSGKSESWVILSCGSRREEGYIYLGFDPLQAEQFSSSKEFKKSFKEALDLANRMGPHLSSSVHSEAAALILPYLNKIRVRPGQIYHLKPGTIHAIGKGVQLFEIQQSSDLTYRVWDWNRPDPQTSSAKRLRTRPLHLKKAFDVIDFEPRSAESFLLQLTRIKISKKGSAQENVLIINKPAGYGAHQLSLQGVGSEILVDNKKRFSVLTVLEGEVVIVPELQTPQKENPRFRKGHSAFLPAFVERFRIQNKSSHSVLVKSFPV